MFKKVALTAFFCAALFLSLHLCAKEPSVSDTICSPMECYTIVKELGEGYFGKVFVVENADGRKYAMKWYKENEDLNEFITILGDAQREFEIGRVLSHPNIIRSHEVFSDNSEKNHYLVLEYVDGQTLQLIPRKGLSKDASLTAALELGNTLHYAYNSGYLYMDLHPGNLMIDGESQLKVIDLAGFFTWEELFGVMQQSSQTKEISPEDNSLEKRIDNRFNAKRAKILKSFFEHYPEGRKKFERGVHHRGGPDMQWVMEWYNPIWFDRVTEGMAEILFKNTMDRDERLDQKASIKRVAWECEEDAADGAGSHTLDPYFERLSGVLHSPSTDYPVK